MVYAKPVLTVEGTIGNAPNVDKVGEVKSVELEEIIEEMEDVQDEVKDVVGEEQTNNKVNIGTDKGSTDIITESKLSEYLTIAKEFQVLIVGVVGILCIFIYSIVKLNKKKPKEEQYTEVKE